MIPFVARRLWNGILTLAALATLTFFVMRLAPGGPFSRNRKISPEVQAKYKTLVMDDMPMGMEQFNRFLAQDFRMNAELVKKAGIPLN